MNRIISSVFTAAALIFGVFLPREEAVAETAKDLAGAWTLVSITREQDGKKTDYFSPQPPGQLIFAPDGFAAFPQSFFVRMFPNSRPAIVRQELQKKTRQLCRVALPTWVLTQ